MNTREEALLLKSAEYKFPIPEEPILTIPEVLDIIKKITNPNDAKLSKILIQAVDHNHQEIVKALLEAKINPNVRSENGELALIHAAIHGHLEIVKLLIAAKADINATNTNGATALFASIGGKNQEVIQSLLDAKADPNLETKNDSGPLNYAAWSNQYESITRLIKAGAKATQNKPTELDLLISHNETDLDGNIREGMTREQLEKALPAINLLLTQNTLLNHPYSLYKYLRVCDQKNSLVKNSYIKLCQHVEKSCGDEKNDEWNKKNILEPTRDYLKKLQIVMQYKGKREPLLPIAPWAPDFDYVSWSLSHEVCNAKKIEELHKKICEKLGKKMHPLLSFFGIAPTVQPDLEEQPSKQAFLGYK